LIDERVGSAELEQLAEVLAPPSRLGDYALEGLIRKTSTALIFIAVGGVFGAGEGVIKLTGKQYAPLLERELCLLNLCREADINGVVRPSQTSLEWLDVAALPGDSAAAILLPFLNGGDLVQLIGSRATRTGNLGPRLALDVGEQVGGVLRELLHQPRPLVHRDVKPQNVLLPYPGAPLTELTLIDFDISDELEIPLEEFGTAPRAVAQQLAEDVHGFGELLFVLATGREPPTDQLPDPRSGNPQFDALVVKCLTSEAHGPGYVCLADNGLWHDLEKALATEKRRKQGDRPVWGPARYLLNRRSLAGLGVVLFVALLAAIGSKVPM
jgi:serine/threonine protein kinase